MTDTNYTLVRNQARVELKQLLQQRSRLDIELSKINARIIEVSKAVNALNLLVGDADENQADFMIELSGMNLSDAVREILRRSDVHLTPLDIKFTLRKLGYNTESYTNPQASIHTMLKRLEESGLVDTILKEGKTAYRLIPEVI